MGIIGTRLSATAVLLAALVIVYVAPQSCTDNPAYASTCQAIFYNTTTNITNTVACANPVFASIVPFCPFSCNLCNQLGFGCNNTLNANQCLSLASNCNNTAFQPFMLDYCPQTCALCPLTGGALNCYDIAQNCSAIASLCNNPATFNTLTQQCPRTCNRCPTNGSSTIGSGLFTTPIPGTCRDVATNCAANIALCTNPSYVTLMTTQCPFTCGKCPVGGTGTCTNQNTLCPQYVANGFCQSTLYTQTVKAQTCALSCNLCSLVGK